MRTGQPCPPDVRARISESNKTHGMRHTPEYRSWAAMKTRCTNPNGNRWQWYGGAGITICDEWMTSFAQFYADMGPRPDGHSLDRIEGSQGYYPGNCRWATKSQQQRNRPNFRPNKRGAR